EKYLMEPKTVVTPKKFARRAPTLTTPNPLTSDQAAQLYGVEEMVRLRSLTEAALKGKYGARKPPNDELRLFLFTYFLTTYQALRERGWLVGDYYARALAHTGDAYVRDDVKCLCLCRNNWQDAVGVSRTDCGAPDHANSDKECAESSADLGK